MQRPRAGKGAGNGIRIGNIKSLKYNFKWEGSLRRGCIRKNLPKPLPYSTKLLLWDATVCYSGGSLAMATLPSFFLSLIHIR